MTAPGSVSEWTFPQYRRYTNGKAWFYIPNAESFEELTIRGKYYIHATYLIKTYSDRLWLHDLLNGMPGQSESISKQEYHNAVAHAHAHLLPELPGNKPG